MNLKMKLIYKMLNNNQVKKEKKIRKIIVKFNKINKIQVYQIKVKQLKKK